MINGKKIFVFILVLTLLFCATKYSKSQTCNNADECNKLINEYQNQITKLQGQSNTLKNQIAQFDAQIKLTTLKVAQTEEQIGLLSGRITQLEGSLDSLTSAFSERAVETYKMAKFNDPLLLLITSSNLNEVFSRYSYLRKAQESDRQLLDRLTKAQNTYKDEKVDQETLQKQLTIQKQNLASQKLAKNSLLTQTKNDEKRYQSLVSQAQAQLASFASFADSKGAFLINNQTYCDNWGCYYNQRDSQWGAILINGRNDCDGPCSLARVGCLATSISMVVSHYGHKDILPSDIANSTSTNYQVNSALLREGTITVKGVNITRTNISNSLNPDLVKDNPVIVGIKYGPFGTHFVVIKEYKDGKYVMNDPFTEGGHDKNFTDYYTLNSVYKVNKIIL